MAKHRKFSPDRFLAKLAGNEDVLRGFVAPWAPGLGISLPKLDVRTFREFLLSGRGDRRDELLEALYRVYDLSNERGRDDLLAACRAHRYNPDPDSTLSEECLGLKVWSENRKAFDLAYDRNTLWQAERFSLFRGKEAKALVGGRNATRRLHDSLAEVFKADKNSERVLVRSYEDGGYTNFVVYHEKRTKAELAFSGTQQRPSVAPMVFRPAQQDFISYHQATGQVEIEARSQSETEVLRRSFAECCLGDGDFFEGRGASNRLNLARIADRDFSMPVDGGQTAALVDLQFSVRQIQDPWFEIRSKDVLETLHTSRIRELVAGGTIRRAAFKITFLDDKRGKRVELSGTNTLKFKRATHADEVTRYLTRWGLLRA